MALVHQMLFLTFLQQRDQVRQVLNCFHINFVLFQLPNYSKKYNKYTFIYKDLILMYEYFPVGSLCKFVSLKTVYPYFNLIGSDKKQRANYFSSLSIGLIMLNVTKVQIRLLYETCSLEKKRSLVSLKPVSRHLYLL